MKILHTVESYLPLKHGMSEVVRQISERLVEAGHDVTVATSYCETRVDDEINGVKIKSFKIEGSLGNGIKGETEKYKDYILNEPFDVITNFAAQQWATDLCLDLLPKLKAKKVFVPTGFSGLCSTTFQDYFDKMKTWMRFYDMNVFLSKDYRDIKFANANGISKKMVIPNGASKKEFLEVRNDFNLRKCLDVPEDSKIVLHVGSYTFLKGHDQALDIFLRSGAENSFLIFVGEDFEIKGRPFLLKLNWFRYFSILKLKKSDLRALFFYLKNCLKKNFINVRAMSLSRQELISAYQQADLFLFPSMLECSPVVLFEAMASNTPFLVTDVGNSKEIIDWSHGGMLLPTTIDAQGLSHADIKGSAERLSDLLKDKNTLKVFAENGYRSWIKKFTWEYISEQYEIVYFKLIS